jgi:phosphohistidine phosphatase
MKTLYLLRHAHAEKAAPPPLGDHERLLSPRGEAAAEEVAKFLSERDASPDFVLSSTALRTLQTVRIIYGKLLAGEGRRVESRFDRGLYLAPGDMLLDAVHDTDDGVQSLLLVAHNPGIAELAQTLSRDALSDHTQDFPPASLAVFTADVKIWADLSPKTAKLETVFVP